MNGMTDQIERDEAEFNVQLNALEREVRMVRPDPKKVSSLAAGLLNRVETMSKMKRSARPPKMKQI